MEGVLLFFLVFVNKSICGGCSASIYMYNIILDLS